MENWRTGENGLGTARTPDFETPGATWAGGRRTSCKRMPWALVNHGEAEHEMGPHFPTRGVSFSAVLARFTVTGELTPLK